MSGLQEEITRLEAEMAQAQRDAESGTENLRAAEAGLRRQRDEAARAASALAAATKDLEFASQERRRLADERRRAEQSILQSQADQEKAVQHETRLRKLVELVEDLSLRHVRERLARLLLEESAGHRVFHLAYTNEELAARLGSVRDVISRTLCGLQAQGLIRLDGRRVDILDMDALTELAGI
jgi:CRP-like cAMP-binding protein